MVETPRSGLSVALGDAFEIANWAESAAQIGRIIGNQLGRLDRAAEITPTGYFNHSFMPDFVLSWEDRRLPERQVFLRTAARSDAFLDDFRLVGEDGPIFVGLDSFEDPSEIEVAASNDRARQPLVADPGGLENLDVARSTNFDALVPNAVVRGGRGVLDRGTAANLSAVADQFVAGASELDSERTSAALHSLRLSLSEAQHRDMSNFGRLLWESAEGEPSEYPGELIDGGLTGASLTYLLENGPTEDVAFWRRLGAGLTTERLTEIGEGDLPALRAAVVANLDRILVRRMVVSPRDPSLPGFDSSKPWTVHGKVVTLRLSNHAVDFAARADDMAPASFADTGISKSVLDERAAHRSIEMLRIKDEGLSVSVEADAEAMAQASSEVDLSLSGVVDRFVSPESVVSEATVVIDGKALTLDFERLLAHGSTNAQFSLVSLVAEALPILRDLGEPDNEELALMLSRHHRTLADLAPQQALFGNEQSGVALPAASEEE